MEKIQTVIIWLICLLLSGGFGILLYKLAGIWAEVRKKRFRDERAEFMSDLYKLQQKWAKRGAGDYCELIFIALKTVNMPEDKNNPKTEYGKETMQKLADIDRELD